MSFGYIRICKATRGHKETLQALGFEVDECFGHLRIRVEPSKHTEDGFIRRPVLLNEKNLRVLAANHNLLLYSVEYILRGKDGSTRRMKSLPLANTLRSVCASKGIEDLSCLLCKDSLPRVKGRKGAGKETNVSF